MKRCPYCGKEYPDDAVLCSNDGYALPEVVVHAELAEKQANPPNQGLDLDRAAADTKGTSNDQSTLAYPDYQWSASDGWKCLGITLLLGLLLSTGAVVIGRYFPSFNAWRRSGPGYLFQDLLHFTLYLMAAAYFARTETLNSFLHGFGLDRKPSNRVWFGIVMALIIRGFGHFILVHRWSKGVSSYDLAAFRNTGGMERYLFLVPSVLFAPFFEETIYRGFVYRAFRNSFPVWASMAIVIAWTANTHWSQYSISWVAAFDLSMLTIVQCYLREKSDSIWDCIFCHFAFNASRLLLGHLFK